MYKSLLIFKYLRKRRIAWVSLIAVMLCTAMVIVVISVMGGWLRMFKESFHGITGDIVIRRTSLSGFSGYEQMIAEIGKLPEVQAAAPTLHTFGLININNDIRNAVQVVGIPLETFGDITGFRKSLYRQYQEPNDSSRDSKLSADDRAAAADILKKPATFALPFPESTYKSILPESKANVANWPGIIVGDGVVFIEKDEKGEIHRPAGLYDAWCRLTVLGQSDESVSFDMANKSERSFWIVDDSKTGVWQYDQSTVYVPFDILQRDLHMDAQTATDATTHQPIVEPARCSDVRIGLKPGANAKAVRDKIAGIVEKLSGSTVDFDPIRVETWEQFNAEYIGAIENEEVLVVVLFGIISVVAIFLIFCIFFMIVVEKTRDIGIIKSVGATNAGVAGVFLGYGLAIGIVGSGLGLLCGYLIVHNINYLHSEMGRLMGIQIWNPKVYAFDIIPNQMDPRQVAIIMAVAISASVLGALVPAIRAARLNPVEALRWE